MMVTVEEAQKLRRPLPGFIKWIIFAGFFCGMLIGIVAWAVIEWKENKNPKHKSY